MKGASKGTGGGGGGGGSGGGGVMGVSGTVEEVSVVGEGGDWTPSLQLESSGLSWSFLPLPLSWLSSLSGETTSIV